MSDALEIKFNGDLQKVKPGPGEVFVLKVDTYLTLWHREQIEDYCRQRIGDFPLLIIDRTMTLDLATAP